LGLILLFIGTILVLGSSETTKQKLKERARQYPRLYRLIRPFVDRCDKCPK
jgi:hypothetical protein